MLLARPQFFLKACGCEFGYFAFSSVIAGLTLLLSGSEVFAQDAHVHGVAELNIVREGQVVQIEFFSPGANLLGFERMPGAAEEWMRFATVVEDLEASAWLLGDQLAGCDMRIEAMDVPSFSAGGDGHDHGDEPHDHEEELAEDAHVDFRVQYLFDCSRSMPSDLRITAFQHFPGIERITTQWIVEGRPGFIELTARAPLIELD
jgi:hypothetical protein